MSKWSIAGIWVLVTVVATTLTWQIVSAADAQVSDRPALQVDAPLAASPDSTSTTQPTSTSTSAASSSTTTTSSPGAPTSTGPQSTSTSSTTAGAWSSQTIPTGGGAVVIRYRVGEVVLGSATPAAGFAADIKKQGPPEVEVEFESESAKYRVKAEWGDGALSVETEADVDD